jgi:flavin-dependent dehydrogenase
MKDVDVVILGGGIAGLGVACQLCAQSKLKVVLIEQQSIGSNKTTPVVFPDHIEAFNITDSIDTHYSRHVLQSFLGSSATFDYKHSALVSINYEKACQRLLGQAERNGLEVIYARALDFKRSTIEQKKVEIVLDNNSSIIAQLFVDASGYRQWGAEKIGIPHSPYYSICIGEVFADCTHDRDDTFWFLAPSKKFGSGGGWYYPLQNRRASMGYAQLVSSPTFDKTVLYDQYNAAKNEFKPFSDWIKNARSERIEYGVIPVGNIKRFSDDQLLIIGDAAGQAIPWSMMGFDSSLKNACVCSDIVLEAFAKKRFDKFFLRCYDKKWKKIYGESFWRTISIIEPTWINRTEAEWDLFLRRINDVPASMQLNGWRYNPTTFAQKIYAYVGFYRRKIWARFSKS